VIIHPANSDTDLAAVYGFIIVEWFIMMILGLYLDKVWPSKYGVRKHPLYPLAWIKKIPPLNRWFARKAPEPDVEDTEEMPADVSEAYQQAHSDELYAVRLP